jgi:hypothetical protein
VQLVATKRITQLPAKEQLQVPDNSSDHENQIICGHNELESNSSNSFDQLCTYGFLFILMPPIDVIDKREKGSLIFLLETRCVGILGV